MKKKNWKINPEWKKALPIWFCWQDGPEGRFNAYDKLEIGPEPKPSPPA